MQTHTHTHTHATVRSIFSQIDLQRNHSHASHDLQTTFRLRQRHTRHFRCPFTCKTVCNFRCTIGFPIPTIVNVSPTLEQLSWMTNCNHTTHTRRVGIVGHSASRRPCGTITLQSSRILPSKVRTVLTIPNPEYHNTHSTRRCSAPTSSHVPSLTSVTGAHSCVSAVEYYVSPWLGMNSWQFGKVLPPPREIRLES